MNLSMIALLLAWAAPSGSDGPIIGPLGVTVIPLESVFKTGQDVRMRLELHNRDQHCVALFVDRAFSPIPSQRRPLTVVRLIVNDSTGREAEPARRIDGQHRPLGLHELLPLECGSSFGRDLRLSNLPWSLDLPKGRYRVRARVTIGVGSFLREHGLVDELRRMWGLTLDMSEGMLRDASAESASEAFEVAGP